MNVAWKTHINDPDGRHIELIDGFVVLFMVPYTAIVILHRKVLVPTTILIQEKRPCRVKQTVSGEESGEGRDVHPVKRSSHYVYYVL
jgi:hypothetical protein